MTNAKAWLRNNYVVIIAVAIWLLFEYMIQSTTGDEGDYQKALLLQSLPEFVSHYYRLWSNRILIDVTAVLTLAQPMILFKVINAVVFALQFLGLKNLLPGNRESKAEETLLLALLLIIPYTAFFDAGFSVTCIYYLWPVTAGIWVIYFVEKESCSRLAKAVSVVLLFFSCNMEQTALLMNGILFLICCRNTRNKKNKIYSCLMLLIAFACMMYMLFGVGGNNRVQVEIGKKFPEYVGLSGLQKIDLGFSTTMEHLIWESDPLWIIFTGLVMLCLIREKKTILNVLGLVPFGFSLAFGLFQENLKVMFLAMKYLSKVVGEYGIIDLNNYDLRNRWIPLFLFFVIIVTIFVDLFLLSDKPETSLVLISIFGLGILSRLIMGFSPTVYASGSRTYYPLWIVLICLIYYLYTKLDGEMKKTVWILIVLVSLVSFCTVMAFLNR